MADDPFTAFRAAYPVRVPNPWAPARIAFLKIVKSGIPAADLIAAAGRYAAECKALKIAPEFIPHARTWLSQRRFEDYAGAAEDAPIAPPADDLADDPCWRALKGRVSREAYRSWLLPCRITVAYTGGGEAFLCVEAPGKFIASEVRRQFEDDLKIAYGITLVRYSWPGGTL